MTCDGLNCDGSAYSEWNFDNLATVILCEDCHDSVLSGPNPLWRFIALINNQQSKHNDFIPWEPDEHNVEKGDGG